MPNCKKCNSYFPFNLIVEGQKRNLQRRKFCLVCSPFNLHNTSDLCGTSKDKKDRGVCKDCGAKFNPNQKKGKRCWVCSNKKSRNKNRDRLYEMMGNGCWLCGYSRCKDAMDFHHYDRDTKKMALTLSEMNLSWDRIWDEAKKCLLLCCMCHREYHAGLIPHTRVEQEYYSRWALINKVS